MKYLKCILINLGMLVWLILLTFDLYANYKIDAFLHNEEVIEAFFHYNSYRVWTMVVIFVVHLVVLNVLFIRLCKVKKLKGVSK